MKKIITTVIIVCTASMLLSSCVSKRKYLAARDKTTQAQKDNAALNNRITRLEDTLGRLHNKVGALGNANENANNELNKTANELNKTNSELYKTNAELNMTKEQITAQRLRLQQMQSFLDQQQKATTDLQKKIADALTSFNASELEVTMKDGKVYISMQEQLLFPSGSAKVNPRGKEALAKVASVLNTSTDINIDIEGHTDNVPIHTTAYPDNWALSTARANSIAHVLIDEYSVSPTRLIASGRASYHPVATNDSPEGRAHNRRTEIILEPKLDELMQLMNGSSTATK